MIRAPYNFVPLNEKVFLPDWSDKISHDVPFSDGESGKIEFAIVADSPLYIRNGSSDKNKQDVLFSHIDNKPFIPGTSLKGMIRNVLQIISFGKIEPVTKWTPTYRDLTKTDTGKEYKNNMKNVHCGWLIKSQESESGYDIIDCGEPCRISHKALDNLFSLDKGFFKLFNSASEDVIDFKKDYEKTAKFKYDMFANREVLTSRWKEAKKNNYIEAIPVTNEEDGKEGTIVFTGQPGTRKDGTMPSGKRLEFVFIRQDNPKVFQVDKDVYNNFRYAYYDGDRNNESGDWKFWKELLRNGEKIPVFFQLQNNRVIHFGLSYLYKLPYKYGIKEGIENVSDKHFLNKMDLADCIFGCINRGDDSISLKGRVQFSHAFADEFEEMDEKTRILSNPKPSYYPNYVDDKGGYNSYELKIKGWKRYPIHSDDEIKGSDEQKGKMTTTFKAIKKAKFKGCIRYHNLRKVELGALMTALTFYDCQKAYHGIGMGKSLGMGKVKIEILKVESENMKSAALKDYMNAFISHIQEDLKTNWMNHKNIIELLTMATPQNNKIGTHSELSHMKLKDKEFIEAKNDKVLLPYYSEMGPEVKRASLQSVEGFLDLLKDKEPTNIHALVVDYKENKAFLTALEIYLDEKPYSESHRDLYHKHFSNPAILYKYLL